MQALLPVDTAFLASRVVAKATLSEGFGLNYKNGSHNNALKIWFGTAKCEVGPETQKKRAHL